MKLSELVSHILEVGSSEKTMIKWFGSGIKIQEKEDWAEKDSRCFVISRESLLVRIDVATDDVGSNFLDIECIKREILKKENKSRLVREMGIIDDLEAPEESVKVGEVHTLELRTDGKSTKVDNITIKKPMSSIAFQRTLKPLNTPIEKIESQAKDAVNPSHYKRGEIECYDALKSSMAKEQLLGHLKATAISYLWRYDLKNGLEDVKKAKWYVDRMVEEMEQEK